MLRLILSKHKTLTGEPGGSGHGHSTEAVFIHVGRYSMTGRGIGQGAKCSYKNRRIGKYALDLFPNLPIIGRNTLTPNEFNLQPLAYCHRYCGPYY